MMVRKMRIDLPTFWALAHVRLLTNTRLLQGVAPLRQQTRIRLLYVV